MSNIPKDQDQPGGPSKSDDDRADERKSTDRVEDSPGAQQPPRDDRSVEEPFVADEPE